MRGFTLEEDLGDNLLGRTLTGDRLRIDQHITNNSTNITTNSSTNLVANSSSITSTSRPGRQSVTTVNGARLLAGPRLAENGVVYWVSAVLTPPRSDVLAAIRADPKGRFTVLLETLRLAGFYQQLEEHEGQNLGRHVIYGFKLGCTENKVLGLIDGQWVIDGQFHPFCCLFRFPLRSVRGYKSEVY